MGKRTVQQLLPGIYFARSRGVVRARDLLNQGWEEADIRHMVLRGELQKVARGLYTSYRSPCTPDRDVVAAAVRIPEGVICLSSALHLHGLLLARPEEVWIAVPEKAWRPHVPEMSLRLAWFSGAAATEGIETRTIEGVPVRVYSPAKTVADSLKYREKLGPSVVVPALAQFMRQQPEALAELQRFAAMCRVRGALRRHLVHAA